MNENDYWNDIIIIIIGIMICIINIDYDNDVWCIIRNYYYYY